MFDMLPVGLTDAPPLLGEEARYAELLAVIAAANQDRALKAAMIDEAGKADAELLKPLFEFHNWGIGLPDHWSSTDNGAACGTDCFAHRALAKSNTFVNKINQTKYDYQDLDQGGGRLNGVNRYEVTFAKGALPPVRGFWSLTHYNRHHFFEPNDLARYSLGTKNKDLKRYADGSLALYVQANSPAAGKHCNWLPSPAGADFLLYLRSYWPEEAITSGAWTPPPVLLTC
jgi:hypothetical protein